MLAAIDAFGVMPGEIKPTGAQLMLPEQGIRANVDAMGLEVTQEMPVSEEIFLEICIGLSAIAQKQFGPLRLDLNFFEFKLLVPMTTEDETERTMLKLRGDDYEALARDFDMVPRSRRLQTNFASGSQRLQVVVEPVAFETVRVHRHHPTIGATRSQVLRAERLSAAADRMPSYAPYAVFLEVLLSEYEPPLSNEEKLFKLMLQKADMAKKLYTI